LARYLEFQVGGWLAIKFTTD